MTEKDNESPFLHRFCLLKASFDRDCIKFTVCRTLERRAITEAITDRNKELMDDMEDMLVKVLFLPLPNITGQVEKFF